MTVDRDRVRSFLQSHAQAQVAFLAKLVKQPSDNPPGNLAAHGELAATLLEELGFAVERHPVPADLVRAAGLGSVTNLIVRRQFGEGPTIALNAHGDVVPPGKGWSTDPYGGEIADGMMHGRGVAVSKSDFATYAFALLALEAAGGSLNGSVELHFTYDEETGGALGPGWLLSKELCRPDYAICAGFSYSVVVAHNGCLHLEIRIRGRQAHAALPASGVDALEAATDVLTGLYGHRADLAKIHSAVPGIDSASLVVGRIEGGVNTNVVPDHVTLRLDRRMIPEEDPAEVEANLTERIQAAISDRPGVEIEISRLLLARALVQTEASTKLGNVVAAAASEVLQEPIGLKGVPLYTDARHYAEAGIPTVLYGAGPHAITEANAHGADERLKLSDLAKATEVVTLALGDLLGAG